MKKFFTVVGAVVTIAGVAAAAWALLNKYFGFDRYDDDWDDFDDWDYDDGADLEPGKVDPDLDVAPPMED